MVCPSIVVYKTFSVVPVASDFQWPSWSVFSVLPATPIKVTFLRVNWPSLSSVLSSVPSISKILSPEAFIWTATLSIVPAYPSSKSTASSLWAQIVRLVTLTVPPNISIPSSSLPTISMLVTVVPEPTPPKVKPWISSPFPNAVPLCLIDI